MTSTDGPALLPASELELYAWEIVRYQQARWALSTRCLSKDPLLAGEALGYNQPSSSSNEPAGSCIRNLANTDPPGHTRLRKLLAKALTPGRMKRMRPQIVRAAGILADRIAQQGSVDLVRSFILPLQIMATCDLFGIPPRHRAGFGALAAGMRVPADSEELSATYHEAYRRMGILVAEVLATKREQIRITDSPELQPDVLSALVSARDDSDGLTVQETQSLAMLLISAGQNPTIDLIANGMRALLLNPDQLQLFRRHPELRPQAVEELLRYSAPVLSALRIAAEDMTIGDTVVRGGSVISVSLGSAHRDPSQFHEPDAFDISRKHIAHLAFGHGIHYCIGAPLARLQASVALTVLVERFLHIALVHSPERLRWRPVRDSRSRLELPVTLGPSEIQSPSGYGAPPAP
ncbi:MAG: cytochrome P450 [Pseudonocardiaceae bacterium]